MHHGLYNVHEIISSDTDAYASTEYSIVLFDAEGRSLV